MKNRTILFFSSLLFVAFSTISVAQTKALKLIETGKYDDAFEFLTKKNDKDSINLVLYYSFAKLYIAKGFKGYEIEKAYNYIKRAEASYMKIKDSDEIKKLEKIPINRQTLSAVIDEVNSAAYAITEAKNTISTYEKFIKSHPETNIFIDKAKKNRNKIAFDNAKKANTCRGYGNFFRKYPDADDVPEAKVKYDEFVKKYKADYEKIKWDGEMSTLEKFIKANSDFPIEEDFFVVDHKLAQLAWDIGLTEHIFLSPFDSTITINPGKDDELNKRLNSAGAKTGDIQISLMWNNYNDLDLHCLEPGKEEIWYDHRKTKNKGELDIDMNAVYGGDILMDTAKSKETGKSQLSAGSIKGLVKPIENIYWTKGKAPSGHYTVSVVYLKNYKYDPLYYKLKIPGCDDPTDFKVRIKINDKFKEFADTVVYNPNEDTYPIYEFDYYAQKVNNPQMSINVVRKMEQYIKEGGSKELAYIALLKYVENDLKEKNWNNAKTKLSLNKEYFSSNPYAYKRIEGLIQLISAPEYEITIENLNTKINTPYDEYSPVITGDDRTLYFCGRDRKDNLGGEDIYYVEYKFRETSIDTIMDASGKEIVKESRDTIGFWTYAKLFKYINTAKGNEAPLSMSFAGNTILLFSGGDLFYSDKTATGWSDMKKFPEPINSKYWEGDAMLSSDGKSIIFASNRPGGMNMYVEQEFYHGDITYASDIYVCNKKKDGSWTNPINLGKSINTAFCERSPYLHPDMKTMYFSSDGHYGLGKLDVYKTTRLLDTSWTQWSEPVNLGKSINTPEADWGYKINTSGVYAYFAANNELKKYREDLYRVKLPENMRPGCVVSISGKVTDTKGTILEAQINWEDLTANKNIGGSKSNPDDGKYFIILPVGKKYGYFAQKDGYYPVSKNLDLSEVISFKEIEENIVMISLEEMKKQGIAVLINNIFFDTDKTVLRPESFAELDRLADILKNMPNEKIEIMGHTDNVGNDIYNKSLSEGRAKAVMEYIVTKSIGAERLRANGYGKTKPIAPNTTDEGRQKNRRVEFKFVN